MAQPWTRNGFRHADLSEWVAENRAKLLSALLTVARAWFVGGRPPASSRVLGSFESWSRIIGGILQHAGVTGFLSNLEPMYSQSDDESADWERFLAGLDERFDGAAFTASELIKVLAEDTDLKSLLPGDLAQDGGRTSDGDTLSRRLGKAFSKRQGRRYGTDEYRLERAAVVRHAVRWRVVKGRSQGQVVAA